MAKTLNYDWQNIASYLVNTGNDGKVTFYIDAKLSSQNQSGNYSVVDTKLRSTSNGRIGGSGYGFSLTGSGGRSGSEVWWYENEDILIGQTTIYHNADGRKNSAISAGAYNSYLGFSINNFSGDIIIPRINKAPFLNNVELQGVTYNSASASFSISDNGGATVTDTSMKIYSDSALTQLVQTQSGTSVTFTGLHSNRDYWIVGSATNSVGTRTTTPLQIKTEGSVVRMKINGEWKETIPYVKVNNQWKEVIPYMRVNGVWKEEN